VTQPRLEAVFVTADDPTAVFVAADDPTAAARALPGGLLRTGGAEVRLSPTTGGEETVATVRLPQGLRVALIA
jgi:hypothetical protein